MEGDGDGNGHADGWIFQGGEEGCQTLGKVVEGDGKGGEEAHPQKFFTAVVREFGMATMQRCQGGGGGLFVEVLLFRGEVVDQSDQQNPGKKETDIEPGSLDGAVGLGQGDGTFLENLHKGDVEHDPGGESRGDGKEAVVGLLRHEGDDAADAGGQAGKERQPKGDPEGAKFHSP